ncbi:MAG: hypothetical protein QF726_10285, partial [Alphaproteobacteria bacterium]|nr:hypothetical protein [Alphaproteobacteria bacterium]
RDYADSLEVAKVLQVPDSVLEKLIKDPEYQALDFRPERPSEPEIELETVAEELPESTEAEEVEDVEPVVLPDRTYEIDGYTLTREI